MAQSSVKISLVTQQISLKQIFPDSLVKMYRDDTLTWTYTFNPTPLGAAYTVKLCHRKGKRIDFYILNPKPLQLAKGKLVLPHVYSHDEQRLCLYYPDGTEWNESQLYTTTIIPWASEWLQHYEIWVGTGVWHGGGTTHN